jgi:hypothetical protein
MKVLVACEYSGIVREAFKAKGHDAWSCDILPTEQPGNHIQGDVRDILNDGWDLMIAHPPCTFLAHAGARWFKVQPDRMQKAEEGFAFFMEMINAPIPLIAVENPYSILIPRWYKPPTQVIHPYQFGHEVTKWTGLWLKGLPELRYTKVHPNPRKNWSKYEGSHNGKARSKTFVGIALAMADQWSDPKRYEFKPVQMPLLMAV